MSLQYQTNLAAKPLSRYQKNAQKYLNELQTERTQEKHAFLNLPYQDLKEISAFAKQTKDKFENIIVLGIGGSSLGGQALFQSLKNPHWNHLSQTKRRHYPRIFFLDEIDPNYITQLSQFLNFRRSLFIIISKSGKTIEILALLSYFLPHLKKQLNKKIAQNLVVITEKKSSPLFNFAKKNKLKIFPYPPDIPGRFSVLSSVGLLPAALIGINPHKILEGAKRADQSLQKPNNLATKLTINQYHLDKVNKRNICVIFPYAYAFEKIADWYIQLLAESIGKNRKTGPTPLKAVGPKDQHSLLQLFQKGPRDKHFLFLNNKTFPETAEFPTSLLKKSNLAKLIQAEQKATSQALIQKNLPVQILSTKNIEESTLGQLLYTLEVQIALLGKFYRVNPYNQPGVELGKKLIRKYFR